MNKPCQICGRREWLQKHHRKRRSQGGTNEPINILFLCRSCHDWIHMNPSLAYEYGWLVHGWDKPKPLEFQWHLKDPGAGSPSVTAPGEPIGDHGASTVEESSMPGAEREDVSASGPLAPGTSCPTCHRRVPHPHKKDSPKTKVFSTRVPVDDAVTFHDILEATAHHLELHERPHWAYWTLLHSMVLALQTPHA